VTPRLCHLRTPEGQKVTEAAVTDPAHWAVLMFEDAVVVDAAGGEPVDEDQVDWTTEHHPDRQPADGTRHANTVVEKTVWRAEYFCADPTARRRAIPPAAGSGRVPGLGRQRISAVGQSKRCSPASVTPMTSTGSWHTNRDASGPIVFGRRQIVTLTLKQRPRCS
jgi:hypothetical protein